MADELRAELAEMLSAKIAMGEIHSEAAWERADEPIKNSWRLYGSRAADALLAAGWRPPLPEGETAFPAEVQSKIDEVKVRVEAMAKAVHTLAVVVSKSNRPDMAGWLAEVAIAITTGREWPTLDALSPLPADETEWEWGIKMQGDGSNPLIMPMVHEPAEERAREFVARPHKWPVALMQRRPAGPWVEVKQS